MALLNTPALILGFASVSLPPILGNTVLKRSRLAVFNAEVVASVPELRPRYLLRRGNHAAKQMRIVPELRELVELRRLNFMDSALWHGSNMVLPVLRFGFNTFCKLFSIRMAVLTCSLAIEESYPSSR
jgi:hypothetical protein